MQACLHALQHRIPHLPCQPLVQLGEAVLKLHMQPDSRWWAHYLDRCVFWVCTHALGCAALGLRVEVVRQAARALAVCYFGVHTARQMDLKWPLHQR